jgi:hypothetical protein
MDCSQRSTIHRSLYMRTSASSPRAKRRHQSQEKDTLKKTEGGFGSMESHGHEPTQLDQHSTCQSQPTSNQLNRNNHSRLARREKGVALSVDNHRQYVMAALCPRTSWFPLHQRSRTSATWNHHFLERKHSVLTDQQKPTSYQQLCPKGHTHQEEYYQGCIRIPTTFVTSRSAF